MITFLCRDLSQWSTARSSDTKLREKRGSCLSLVQTFLDDMFYQLSWNYKFVLVYVIKYKTFKFKSIRENNYFTSIVSSIGIHFYFYSPPPPLSLSLIDV